ncbi:YlxR family protein [Microaerobacter geothermalis]|uniref:RNase P modulator RnpM n=1 Tax=Microaerobacter geothermalis TaxID=674972 RepID=UPI001F34CD15|nr:YlxR family protein [Microaerobacter geothermalis]MCF6093192.1 YlxR family protein [Microaerobacter geothermalis]
MKKRKIPMRKCVACQEMKPKKELIRIVRTPEMKVMIDPSGKASGRGAYLCARLDCFKLARKRNAFDKALEMKISDEVYIQLEEEWIQDYDKK